jgi:predicted SprT family Zn-dependent metalloprotease
MLKRLFLIGIILAVMGTTDGQERRDRLNPWYNGYNEKYFNNELPKDVLITHDLHDDRFVADTEQYKTGFYHIAFNPKFNLSGREELLTLLHESCHIRLMSSGQGDELDQHGARWQDCMLTLAKQGAFADLW